MPGIFGFTKSASSAPMQLNQVAKAMKLYDHFIQDSFFEDEQIAASRVHLGKIGEKSSPATLGGLKIWVEGEAYNQQDVAERLGLKQSGLADLLLEAYAVNKLDVFLNLLDGYFCAALYDKDNQKVKLFSDRYGMRMLYWYAKDGVFAWGSEVKAILACEGVDKTIDPTSYDCFMTLGYLLGEHTWFTQIKLIKPATVLTYDLKKRNTEQHYYWTWAEVKPCDLNFDQAVDELGKRFIKAVELRFDPSEKVGIALSGGLDSRAIFAALNYLYPDFKGYAYTFGIPGCDDIAIAEQVISQSNWSHQSFHFSGQNWIKPRLEKVWNTDGLLDVLNMHGIEFISDVSNSIDINLNGYAGDALFGGSFLSRVPLNVRMNFENSKIVYKGFSGLANIDDAFYDIHKIEPNIYMNRIRRFTNMGTVNGLVSVEQRKPFFDNSCVEFVFSIPDEYRANNKVYSEMLRRFFPKYFKSIPWQKTGKPIGSIVNNSLFSRLIAGFIYRARRFLSINSSQDFTDYNLWIRDEEVVAFLRGFLSRNDSIYSNLTSQDLMVEYLDAHIKGIGVDKSKEILRGLTIEAYLRQVF